jgi:hypothetical protein
MKQNVVSLFIRSFAVITAILVSSCVDDNGGGSPPPRNYELNHLKADLSRAVLLYATEPMAGDETLFVHDLVFLSETVLAVPDDVGTKLKGVGNVIAIQITSSSQSLEPGVYEFTKGTPVEKNFTNGRFYLDYNHNTGTGEILEFEDGVLNITKSSGKYSIVLGGVAYTGTENVVNNYIDVEWNGEVDHLLD